MGTIATNYETVGVSEQASVSIDVDAMVRKSMIKLFGLKDANDNVMSEYDDAYLEAGLPTTDDPGMPSLVRGFIIFETETLSFMFQQVLYILTPIKTALELPQLLTNPVSLIEKIKEIIESIKKMIDDVTKFITDTKQWFIDTLLGGLADINVPIPEITITILGVDITLPKIDKGDLFNPDTWLKKGEENPFEEKGGSKIAKLKDEILELQKKLSSLRDNLKDIMDNMIATLLEVQVQLTSILYTVVNEHFELAYELHNKLQEKLEDSSSDVILLSTEIEDIKTELSDVTDKDSLTIFNGSLARLLKIPTELIGISTTDITTVGTALIDDIINDITSKIENKIAEAMQPIADLQENIQSILDMKDVALEELQENIERIEQDTRDKIKEKMDEIMILSPATAWILTMVQLMINIIKAPISFIVDLITKMLEGVIQFLQELPLPTFEKFKEFFADLLGVANISKMSEIVTGVIETLAPFADSDLISKVAEFIPDLIVTTGVKFVTSIVEPLPIPI